jgi:hypothetical protein
LLAFAGSVSNQGEYMGIWLGIIERNTKFNPHHEIDGIECGHIDERANGFSDLVKSSLSIFSWYKEPKISNNVFALNSDDITEENALSFINDTLHALREITEKDLVLFDHTVGYFVDPNIYPKILKMEDWGEITMKPENLFNIPEKGSPNDSTQYWESPVKKAWWKFW